MKSEQWHRVKEVFEAALDRAPEERSAFVGQACAGDELLHSEVESLLSSYEQEKSFLETPAAAMAAHSLVKEESAALVGQHLGHYQVIREIGRGGMGVVYLAQDVSLDRPVALKLLPKHLTNDPNRLRRFEREARAASALNHHNILTIYEIAQLDGLHFIATEFIDGVTLRERIKSNELELSETLNIAEQIASALMAAHEAGIVHRDIKPENVMLRRDGYVKVLDFGLAKLTEQQTATRVSASAATAGTNTDTGVMGTVGYMSPEQARGESVDHRTDIFSLGVVIYEMVTGQMPFAARPTGNVPIPEQEPPPLAHYVPEAPSELQLIVNKALRTNKEERYQTIAEFLVDLRRARSERPPHSNFTRRLSLWAATLALVVGGALWFYASRQTAKPSRPLLKALPFTSLSGAEYLPSFSPDGNKIAFSWDEEGEGGAIYVKEIGTEKLLRLTFSISGRTTRRATTPTSSMNFSPVWSPDGQTIAFNRHTETECAIFTVAALGGTEHELLTLGPNPGWPTVPTLAWSPDGRFIAFTYKYSKEEPNKIFFVSPDTSSRQTLTSPSAGSVGDFCPAFSPDGQSVAFFRMSSDSSADIYIVPVTGGEPRRLTFDNASIFGLDWTADGREIVFSSNRAGGMSPLESGSRLWRIPASGGTAEQIALGGDNFGFPRIARHGNRLTYAQSAPEDANIYRIEVSDKKVSTDPPNKLIASTRYDGGPQFSPDGRRITFHSDRSGQLEIWTCDSDGTNLMQITSSGLNQRAGTPRWSPDGRQIAFDLYDHDKGDIYVIGVDGGPALPIATGDSDDHLPSWSRDGKWIYFASDRSGQLQVWKAPAQGGEAVQVTRQGGYLAFESFDGKHVYYIKPFPTQGIWQVPVDGGEELQIMNSFQSALYGDWAVGNDGIYFINEHGKDGMAIDFFDFAGRKVRQVASLGKVHILETGIAVSPDGRQILYTQIDGGGADIKLVENFR
ncbi:MAG TPA: protein kinase [Pyrinomonadaceae bacterium]